VFNAIEAIGCICGDDDLRACFLGGDGEV